MQRVYEEIEWGKESKRIITIPLSILQGSLTWCTMSVIKTFTCCILPFFISGSSTPNYTLLSLLEITTGNPGVSQGNLDPYQSKPIPLNGFLQVRVGVFWGHAGHCESLPLAGSMKNCLDTVVNYLINFIPLYVKLKLVIIFMQLWKNNNLSFHIWVHHKAKFTPFT